MKIAEVGQRVRWASQAGGWWKTKEGEVIYAREADDLGCTLHVPAGDLPEEFIEAPKSRRVSGDLGSWGRDGWVGSSGLIVRVDTIDGKPTSRPLYYSPARTFRIEVVP